MFFCRESLAHPIVEGPFTQLRKAPVFESELVPLSKNWGSTIPMGQEFRIEKIYGRWLYGSPEPLSKMKEAETKDGWLYSRMLLTPGDKDTLSPANKKLSFSILFHSREILGSRSFALDFLESLVLSQKTLEAFRQQDERLALSNPNLWNFTFFPLALAEKKEESLKIGLAGVDFQFLDQEFEILKKQKEDKKKALLNSKLRPPSPPAFSEAAKEALVSRLALLDQLDLPALTHEEIDGFIYMRAIAHRVLSGCEEKWKKTWKDRRWNIFRYYREKGQSGYPWGKRTLPAGYFALSAKAIDTAQTEAELAYLLVRFFLRESQIERKKMKLPKKLGMSELRTIGNEHWLKWVNLASTKENPKFDIADELSMDQAAIQCLMGSGYSAAGSLSYLRRIALQKDAPWAKEFFDHSIGWEFRMEKLAEHMEKLREQNQLKAGVSNTKRFSTASRYWNLMP